MNPPKAILLLHGRTIAAVFLALLLSATGCSKDVVTSNANADNDKPVTLAVNEARGKANHISSRILDMIGIREGKVAGGGAGVSLCENDPKHLYRMRHPWSIYEVSEDKLKQGFQRLRKNLPGHGWRITDYGPTNSRAKTLELTADSETEPFSVNVELVVSTPTNPHEPQPMILVHVVSGCFRAPKGTNLDREY